MMPPESPRRRRPARIGVVIPALDEEQALGHVLRELREALQGHGELELTEVVVADNGSRDRTAAVAREQGATVVHEPRRGYGAACLRGLAELGEVDVVVFLDADRSDYPGELEDLVTPILAGAADLVIGSRALGQAERGSLTAVQRFGNRLASTLLRWIWGLPCTDLGPFRAVSPAALRRLCMSDLGYGWTVEMQARAARLGLRVLELPVSYRRRVGRSKISGTLRGVIGAGTKILWTIGREACGAGLDRLRRRPVRSAGSAAQSVAHGGVPRLSIIIPTLDEEAWVESAIASARAAGEVEVLVVDGGSSDATVARAAAAGARVLSGAAGRAAQMNAGAAAARGGTLLFLHADTRLPFGYLDEVERILGEPRASAGAFRFALDRVGPGWRAIELGAALRSSWLGSVFGDQALFLHRATFERVGGFPALALLEDHVFVRRLRRLGRVRLARSAAITSARRWETAGALRTTLMHQVLLAGYRLGVAPATLARWRERGATKRTPLETAAEVRTSPSRQTPARVLVLIAKAPLPAFAKTRLTGAGGLGPSGVARLAQAFLEDTLRAVAGVADIELQISYAPQESRAFFAALAPGARLVPQGEGDLGARLVEALAQAFAQGAARVVMIGTDTPHIGAERIERAFELLAHSDCVLGPASDGGYYLIGLGAPRPSLFEGVEWSSERVFAETCARARAAGLRTALLSELFDLDRPADLERLAALLDASGEPCPHTARALAAEAGRADRAGP